MATTHNSSSTPRRSRTSDRIGAFERKESIGRGSFATVYKAIHTVSTIRPKAATRELLELTSPQNSQNVQTIVAIKSVNLEKLNKKLRDNLTSEISILKGLHHPHIVALIDCKETSSHIHLVMEYVALGDLSHFIKQRDSLRRSELVGNMLDKYPNPPVGGLHEVVVRHFLQQLASALQFLRARNLIHRDVKPQNLLLNPSPAYFEKWKPDPMPYRASDSALQPLCGVRSLPMLKIADFGFARALPPTSLAETLCGSPLYMAPEILRYEKYDAKADLWSVGTVLYEMVTAKPPFKAANHVELLRRIEKGEDRIKFSDEIVVSEPMKKLIRLLLKRDPRQRLDFPEFFGHGVVIGEIPGLADEDLPRSDSIIEPTALERRRSSRTDPTGIARPGVRREPESPYLDQNKAMSEDALNQNTSSRRHSQVSRQPSISTRPQAQRKSSLDRPVSPTDARPKLASHVTAPGRQELQQNNPTPTSTAMARQGSGSGRPPSSLRNELLDEEQARLRQQEKDQERAAQDIAFEREYVVVEKKQIEVNAFADEMAASPRVKPGTTPASLSPKSGAMVRRATVQGATNAATGAQTSASRAVSIASGRPLHQRTGSYERPYRSPNSATSAISKAINLASGRLFGIGFSPPVNFMRGGKSPPGYSPFPIYPGAQSSLVVVGESNKPIPLDEDARVVAAVEEVVTWSDVVYGFAEVKYKQITPANPSTKQAGLGLRDADTNEEQELGQEDLTIEALVIVSEEALVLYVKALALLAKALQLSTRWWYRKGEAGADGLTAKAAVKAQQRMNQIVQWARDRFNEILSKTELVRLRLIDSQKRLPEDHPSHPNNISAETASSAGLGNSAEQVIVSSGVTAEKLMYDRAVEMSRTAALNELSSADLPGCEISYVTAIRMLEAVLENDDEPIKVKDGANDKEDKDEKANDAPINGLWEEDRKTVNSCRLRRLSESDLLLIKAVVASIRNRLARLRRKIQAISERSSGQSVPSSPRASPPVGNGAGRAVAVSPKA
jgi:serine/threonine-protein kinase ULK2